MVPQPILRSRILACTSVLALGVFLFLGLPGSAHAASSWNPTLLVNTESFQTIDVGDGTTDIELRFGTSTQTIKFLTTGKFQFSKGISVLGTISGSSLNVDRNATVGGTFTVTGAVTGMSTITAKGNLSGATLTVSRGASISGSLIVKNNIAAKGTVSGSTITGFGLGTCNGPLQKIVYNNATGKFECATDVDTDTDTQWSNTGALGANFDRRYVNTRGDTMTGTLVIRSTSGAAAVNLNVIGGLSGAFLRISGPADIHGALTVTGAIKTDNDLTINDDAGAIDAVLTFGNASGNQTLKFLNTAQKFQFSKGISVLGTISGSALNVDRNATIGGTLTATGSIRTKGNLSGSSLTVDGSVTLHGQTYNFPVTQTTNGFLKTDGAGNLTWSASANNGSGAIISLHPEFPNAIYFSSGSTFVGQLSASGGVAGLVQNYYHWVSSKATLQNYWVAVRVRLPDNFSAWDPVKPIELLYRTQDGTSTNNHVSVRMRDTAGAYVDLSNNVDLVNAGTFTTANIKGPETGGTWAAKGYVTVYIKMAALTGKYADVGYLNLNFENTNP